MTLHVANLENAVVGPVSFDLPEGGCLALTGASGSGKTVLLRMIADLEPNRGAVAVGDLRREAMEAPAWRRAVSFCAAESGWWSEIVAPHMPADRVEAFGCLAEALGLSSAYLQRSIRTLSTGERQRLALIRTVIRAPKVLLLDEPTAALDPESVTRVEGLFRRLLDSGTTLVVVTHDAGQAARLGTAFARMASGRLVPA